MSLEEGTADSRKRRCVIVDGRVQEAEGKSYSVLSVVDLSRNAVATGCRRRGSRPGRNDGRLRVHGEEPQVQVADGQRDECWSDEKHEDGGWASEMWQYRRS